VAEGLPVIYSLDCCQQCLTIISEAVKNNYKPVKVGTNCDLCGIVLTGDYTLYQGDVTKVSVSLSAGVDKCRKCGRVAMTDPSVGCKNCGIEDGNTMSRFAKLATDNRFLQLSCCESDYKKLVERSINLRQSTAEASTKRESNG